MSEKVGILGRDLLEWKQQLIDAGCVDVAEKMYEILTNPWPI